MKSPGINGLAVTAVAVGVFLNYAGWKNVPIVDGLREILRGQTPTGKPAKRTEVAFKAPNASGAPGPELGSNASGVLGSRIVAEAQRYIGVPYRFGGATPAGFDCSGLVQYVLRKVGVDVPSNVRRVRDFVRWSGVAKVARASVQPGDLVCWDFVHMGIAVERKGDELWMVHAPAPGQNVKIQKVWNSPPPTHYLRVQGG